MKSCFYDIRISVDQPIEGIDEVVKAMITAIKGKISYVTMEAKERDWSTDEEKDLFFRMVYYCPKCGSPPSEHEVRNFDVIARDGDVVCKNCNSYVRMYDAS